MRRLYRWLVQRSVPHLIRAACVVGLVALSSMAYSVISLKPLPVIFAMSVGHAIGIFAFSLYLLAVLLDTQRRPTEPVETEPSETEPVETEPVETPASADDSAVTPPASASQDTTSEPNQPAAPTAESARSESAQRATQR